MKKIIILSLLLISGLNASDYDYDELYDEYDPSTDRSEVLRLHEACIDADIHLIEKYIRSGDDINAIMKSLYYQTYYGYAPIHIACKKNDLYLVKYLIEKGANINIQDISQKTPLDIAILNNNVKLFEYLWNSGSRLGDKDNKPLYLASQNNSISIVKWIVEKVDHVNNKNSSGSTALHLAIENGHEEVTSCLMSKNPDIDIKDKYGNTPLLLAIKLGHINIVKILLSRYSELKKDIDLSALCTASERNKTQIIELLINSGANIHLQNKDAFTPIEISCKYDNLETFQYLLKKELELDSNYLKSKKQFLIDLAIKTNKLAIFNFIYSNYGLDNVNINELMHSACVNGNLAVVKILVAKEKFNIISFIRENDSYILFEIFKDGKIDILKYLIKLDQSLISEKFKGNYILSYNHDAKMYIDLLNYLDFFPDILKKEYFGENINNPDIAIALLQRSFLLNNNAINTKIKDLFPNNEVETVPMFIRIRSQLLEILQSNNIAKIKAIKNLNIFFSPMQMAEIIIKKILDKQFNEKVVAELLNFTALYYDLLELKDHNGKSIVQHIVEIKEKGENLCLLIYKLYKDKISAKIYIGKDKFYIEFEKAAKAIQYKKDTECVIM